jgi:transcriptional regulator with XRE-family HTH domain
MKADDLAEALKQRRKLAGITQRDLAELADVAVHTVSDLESGKGNPTLDVLSKLAGVLGLEIYLRPRTPGAINDPGGIES